MHKKLLAFTDLSSKIMKALQIYGHTFIVIAECLQEVILAFQAGDN